MKIQKVSLAILAAAGLLGISTVAQADDTNTVTPPKQDAPPAAAEGRARGPGGRGFSAEAQMERFNRELTLTEDQKPKVKALLEEQNKKMTEEVRTLPAEERRAKMMELREEISKKMKEILTAEQFEKYEKMFAGGRRGQGRQGGGDGNPPPQQ